jgi:hypothetical protein
MVGECRVSGPGETAPGAWKGLMARLFLSRCLCRLYRVLLCAYPCDFRRRYGGEMAQVFGDALP